MPRMKRKYGVGHTLDHVPPGKQPRRSLRMSKSQKSNNQEVKDEGESVSQSSSGNVIWTKVKTTALFSYIKKHCAQGGDGLNFRRAFGQEWQLTLCLSLRKDQQKVLLVVVQNGAGFVDLHTKYNEISAIANLSGVPWDSKLGLNILDKSEVKNPGAKAYKREGWVHYSTMQELLGGQHAKVLNAFCTPRVPQVPKVKVPKMSTSTTQVSTLPVSATTNSTTSIAPAPAAPAAPTVSHAVPAVVAAAPAIPCVAVSDIAAKDPPGHINNWLGGLPSPTSAYLPVALCTYVQRPFGHSSTMFEQNLHFPSNYLPSNTYVIGVSTTTAYSRINLLSIHNGLEKISVLQRAFGDYQAEMRGQA
ncbi:hypothetical protein SERLADRAFT_411739 [Serpula lacrymans var. lacrymans S7.9]|uniref:Uncharacterized protein n=1 Tax=Serpula lacrymans var. lacrymans (strain S7.9) TaxID=578457 RepID=F8PC19_SERL9|nr:uncharacterized protein SERLADRAFT_411739 [Serpula lacrymans var. lacrymans S7.9]EGO19219.1 hypothetical protein SERLADRAFT_411739 [Serpula lacrymans var. lacrymans S7.9]